MISNAKLLHQKIILYYPLHILAMNKEEAINPASPPMANNQLKGYRL